MEWIDKIQNVKLPHACIHLSPPRNGLKFDFEFYIVYFYKTILYSKKHSFFFTSHYIFVAEDIDSFVLNSSGENKKYNQIALIHVMYIISLITIELSHVISYTYRENLFRKKRHAQEKEEEKKNCVRTA